MIYARVNANGSVDLIDLEPAYVAALVAAGNPKAATLRTYVIDPQPTPGPTQLVRDAGFVVEPLQVRQTWALAPKPAAQLDQEADAAELAQIQAAIAALRDGTGTATERLVRVERVCVWLLKQAAKRGVV